MNTNIHEWWILKIKKEIRVHSCSFVAERERLNTHTEIALDSASPLEQSVDGV
jgi:hypothetical protein